MSSRSLVASPSLGLPIAQMRSVFSADDVERKLAKLQASGNEREYESLRNTWQRMLERGPQRAGCSRVPRHSGKAPSRARCSKPWSTASTPTR